MFITFEGIDRCGKTTQLKYVQAWLADRGLEAVLTREPGGTELGEKIRRLLLVPETEPMVQTAELFLYLAARAQLVHTVIRPALKAGRIVIADRFGDSTWAYQVAGRGLSEPWMKEMIVGAQNGLTPDLTLLFDMDPAQALARSGAEDRLEQESVAFFERVRQAYLALAQESPQRFRVIAANRPPAEIWADVQAYLTPFINNT